MVVRIPRINRVLQFSLFIMVLKVSLNATRIIYYTETIDIVLSVIAAVGLCMVILNQKYSLHALLAYAVIGILGVYSAVITKNGFFIITILTCCAVRKVAIDDVIRHIFLYESIFLVLHTLVALMGHLFFDVPIYQYISGKIRYTFGFGHPNTFSLYYFNVILMYLWIQYNKITKGKIGILLFITAIVYWFTKTRSITICIVCICGMFFVVHKEKSKLVAFIAKYITPICALVTLFMCEAYTDGNLVITVIDRLLSGRIKLGAYAAEYFGYTFMGQNLSDVLVEWDSYWRLNAHTFDNIYTFFAMNCGILWLITICALFYSLAKKQNNRINIFIIIWALYGITEVHGINCFMFFPTLLLTMRELPDYNQVQKKRPENK